MTPRITTAKLFKLIKALKKEEKRYFKLFTKNNTYKQGKYLEIFEALNKQTVLDLDRYKQKLKHIKQLSSLQSYLYEQILQSLQAQHTGNNIERQIMDGLIRIELLFERNLIEEAKAMVYKIETLAIEHDQLLLLPSIYVWWFKLENNFLRYRNVSKIDFHTYKDKLYQISATLKDYTHYYAIVSEGLYLKQYESSRAISTALKKLEQEDADAYEATMPDAVPVKIIYLQLKAFFAASNYNYSVAYKYWNELCLYLAVMPEKRLEHYQYLYYDAIHACAYNGSFIAPAEDIPFLLEQLESIPNLDSKTYLVVVKHKLILKMNQAQKALEYIHNCPLNFEHLPLNYQFTFYYNLGINYFILNQYDEALKVLKPIIEDTSGQVPHIKLAAFILKIITFYEKDEYLILPYLLQSMQRKLKSTGNLFKFEQLFLKFIKKIIKTPKRDRASLFYKFKEQYLLFVDTVESSEQREFLIFFNYEGWIDSHIQGQNFDKAFPY